MNISPEIAAELLYIINYFPHSYYQKIPNDIIEYLHKIHSQEHYSSFDKRESLYSQKFSEETIEYLNFLITKYFS